MIVACMRPVVHNMTHSTMTHYTMRGTTEASNHTKPTSPMVVTAKVAEAAGTSGKQANIIDAWVRVPVVRPPSRSTCRVK